MAERRSLKAKGIVFTDLYTSKESRKNKSKKATPKKCSKNNKGLDLGCITTSLVQDYGRPET